jgi:hypothetical protein
VDLKDLLESIRSLASGSLDAGKVTKSDAERIAGLVPEQQEAEVARMIADPKTQTKKEKAAPTSQQSPPTHPLPAGVAPGAHLTRPASRVGRPPPLGDPPG